MTSSTYQPRRSPLAGAPVRAPRGFTLIEVLVSLLILAVLSATAWKGMDSISTARQVADGNLKQTLRLQSVVTQFEADMGQIMDTQIVDGMQFDGAHLRLTRRSGEGMQVVTWYVQRNRLLRWASPVTTKVGELQRYWLSSYQLQGREPGTLTALKGVERWQVYCFRGGSMSSCQSTGDAVRTATPVGGATGAAGAAPLRQALPNAVRCQMTLGEGSGFAGTLTRDVMLAPQLQGS
ncbi:MAG: prepilin-type N-terminal cleavage/methylation domain-containing protein [Aquabacterium sp.]|nr:prepilin-type N-terminal cleavage/methylation domain-containing protein [Aquabacterium sp.]